MNKLRRMVLLSLLVAMASAVHYLEGLVPILVPGVPGVKLGLANVFSLFALTALGPGDAFSVVILRSLLTSAVWGQPVSLAYSLAGGLLSMLVMWLLYKYTKERLSLYGISAAGAFFHNVGQLCAAALILQSGYVFGYLPVMTVIAVPTGLFVGMLTQMVRRPVYAAGLLQETENGDQL